MKHMDRDRRRNGKERSIIKGPLQGRGKSNYIKVTHTHAFTRIYTCLHVKHIHIVNKGHFGLRIYKCGNAQTLRYGKHKAILKIGDDYFQTPNQETMSKAVASLYKAVDNPEDLLLPM